MTFRVPLDGGPADLRARLDAVAAALRAAGVESVLVDWAADGLPGWANVEPRRVVGTAPYGAALDEALAAAAGTGVDWEPVGAGDPHRDRAVYRLAVSLGRDAAVERVVLASLDPETYVDRDPYADDAPSLSVQACYAGLGEADTLVGVDWKSTRLEASTAIGGLLIMPDGRDRVADTVPGYAALLRRCEAGDRANVGIGPGLPAGDPLRAEGQHAEPLVAAEAAALAAAASVALLRLDNGDTPGYLACRVGHAATLLDLAAAAGLPFERLTPG